MAVRRVLVQLDLVKRLVIPAPDMAMCSIQRLSVRCGPRRSLSWRTLPPHHRRGALRRRCHRPMSPRRLRRLRGSTADGTTRLAVLSDGRIGGTGRKPDRRARNPRVAAARAKSSHCLGPTSRRWQRCSSATSVEGRRRRSVACADELGRRLQTGTCSRGATTQGAQETATVCGCRRAAANVEAPVWDRCRGLHGLNSCLLKHKPLRLRGPILGATSCAEPQRAR